MTKAREIVSELVSFLISDGVELGCFATPEEIARFSLKHGIVLPTEVKEYFKLCNGTNGHYAHGIVRLWALSEVSALSAELSGPKRSARALVHSAYNQTMLDTKGFYVFADFLHEAKLYAMRLGPLGTGNEVVVLDGGDMRVTAASFAEFLNLYMNDPAAIGAEAD
jgi:hypothetical protein